MIGMDQGSTGSLISEDAVRQPAMRSANSEVEAIAHAAARMRCRGARQQLSKGASSESLGHMLSGECEWLTR